MSRAFLVGMTVVGAAVAPAPIPAQEASARTTARTNAPVYYIHHVRVFDGVRLLGARDVIVRDGRVAVIAKHVEAPAEATVVEGGENTLLPGLIDAHTHAFGDALQQALVFGVTTELDLFTDPRFAAAMRAEQKEGNATTRADLYSAGFLATVPGGHGTEYGFAIPTITSPDSAQAWVDARIAEGSDYIKIVIDDGSTYGMHTPTLSPTTVGAIVRAAHARGKLVVVHVGSLADARTAIDAGADGLAHLFVDRAPDADFGRFVKAHHAFVIPTLDVLRSITGSGASHLADDPQLSPYLSATGRRTLAASFPVHGPGTTYAGAEAAVRQLRAAGVPILAGTDSPNPGTAHGISMHDELALLVNAGLTPTEALVAATSAPARAFRLPDRGIIAPGARADLLLVAGDPTKDITATRAVRGIWKDGHAVVRAPAEIQPRDTVASRVAAGMISDFEDGSMKTSRGTGWIVTTDKLVGGASAATIAVVDGGADGTLKALESSGTVAPGLPYAWAGAMYMPGTAPMQPADLSGAKAIRFWARGDGRTYHVMVFSQSHGGAPLTVDFVAAPEWKEYRFPFSAFSGIDGHDVMGIAFTAGPQPGSFRFRIDQVALQ